MPAMQRTAVNRQVFLLALTACGFGAAPALAADLPSRTASSLPSLAATLPATALALIVAGGLIYSAGVPFYVWRSLKFQNAIWHACVALGAALQFGGVVAAIGAPS